MKKTISTTILTALVILVLTMPASAATIVSFSPASVNVASGQSFNVAISINPQGISNYAEKIELKYPADMLQVNSFTLGSAWMALTQPGYDLVDNTNGALIKSAGYPGGFSSATTFGTASFYAKKAGSGTITIGNNALAFEVTSQSALSGSPVSFTITVPAATAPKPTTPTQVIPLPNEQPTSTAPVQQPAEQPASQAAVPANISLGAAIGGFLTLGTGSVLIGILVVILILAIAAYAIYIFIQRKKRNK